MDLIFHRRMWALVSVMALADASSTYVKIALCVGPRKVAHCVSHILRRGASHQCASGGVRRLAIHVVAELVVPFH